MKVMVSMLMVLLCFTEAAAQEEVEVEATSVEIEQGLDLEAVGELFKDSEDLEEFEKSLNDPDIGVNNLDLDENDDVDFIRVLEEVEGDVHLIILQAALAEEEYQDVATIEIEQNDDETYNMQIQGNEDIYGSDYYVSPAEVQVHTWPIIKTIYKPTYRPYRSPYLWGKYPKWWIRRRPVKMQVYKPRIKRYTGKTTFVLTRYNRLERIHRIKYKPRRARVIKKRTIRRKRAAKRAHPAKKRVRKK
ncbi:MAG: hypothetical protein R6V04_06540 [bacterium]